MITNANIRYDKSWRFVFMSLCIFYLSATSLNAQNVVPNFLVNKPMQCMSGNSFVLTNITQGDNISYRWDFGDNTFDTATNVVKTYNQTGNFTINLIATKNNISYYFSKQVIVGAEPVISSISLQGTYSGKSYTFISSSTIASGNMSYFWDFGDTTSSTLINPTHTYKTDGIYPVVLSVISDLGCTTYKNYTVNIVSYDSNVIEPKFSINKSNQCISGNNFIFTNHTNLSQSQTSYWEFGDGTTSYSINANKSYTNAGIYTVKLNVIKSGVTYTTEKRITVGNIVNAAFDGIKLNDSTTYIFSNQTTGIGLNTQYFWDFGDGCSAISTNPKHQFFAGNYLVKLTTIDSLGCSSTVSKPIAVSSQAFNNITSFFSVNSDTQCLINNNFTFTNLSSKSCNISYLWDFGDNTTSKLFAPTKHYSSKGVYTISLKVFAGTNVYAYSRNIVVKNESLWTGTFSNNFYDSANWQCSYPTTSSDILIAANTPHNPILNDSNFCIKNLTIQAGAVFSVNNSNLKLIGNLVCFGSLDAQISTIEFNGSNKQIVSGKVQVNNLIINNDAGVDVANSSTDSISVYTVLTLKKGAFCTANMLILRSTAKKTARLDKVNTNGNIGSICGKVTVERYFQNKRAWRFVTVPLTSNGNNSEYNINSTWKKFTNITGPAGVGLDYISPYYSLNSWDDINQKWNSVSNTYSNYIVSNSATFSNTPYFIFVRGDKSISEAYSSGEVTFSSSGFLQTGNQTINFSGKKNGNYLFVGNPYPSPIDLSLLSSQGLNGNFYLYDATLNTNGAYVTISNKGNDNWIITPAGCSVKDRVLQSGQAMLVGISNPSGYLTFNENAKTDCGNNFTTFGNTATSIDKLEINLFKINADSSKTLLDGAVTIFGNNYSKDVDGNDSKKIMNAKENIGFKNGNDILSIEARPFVHGNDSLSIYISDLYDTAQYAAEVKFISGDTIVKQIVLNDSSLNSQTRAVVGKTIWYYFNTANIINNSARFSLVVQSNTPINAPTQENIVTLSATQISNKINVNWKVEAENALQFHTVQHSINNIDYENIATVNAVNNNKTNSYVVDDESKPVRGTNYYRIASTTNNDVVILSKPVVVDFSIAEKKGFSVFPNPTQGKINLELYSASVNALQINITENATGKVVKTVFVKTKLGSNKYTFNLSDNISTLNNGLYTLSILSDDVSFPSQKIMLLKEK